MPTGGGKSVFSDSCDDERRNLLVVSPLVALMKIRLPICKSETSKAIALTGNKSDEMIDLLIIANLEIINFSIYLLSACSQTGFWTE
jgi:superfamily II DNA helicase RecQ